MYNILRAKNAFKQNRNKTPQESINQRQPSQSVYDQSNYSLSVTKSKTNNSTTMNTINRTSNSFYIGPRRDKLQTYTIELQKTMDADFGNKLRTGHRESGRQSRKVHTSYGQNDQRLIQHSKSVIYGKKEVENDDEQTQENMTIVQQGLIQEPSKPLINTNEELTKIKEQVNSMYKNLEPDTMEVDQWDYQVDYGKLELKVFSLDELRYLIQEFEKEEYERNYLTMDKILLKNKFFQRFGQGIRIGIMEKASMEIHDVGEVILQLGANSNNLYVILRGSCQQTLTMDIQLEEYQCLTVQSYFDGQDLSEINLLQLNNSRGYSANKFIDMVEEIKEHPKFKDMLKNERTKLITSHISCAEKTYLLRMDNDQFQKILKQSIEKDKEFKLSILSQIRFFQHTSASQLLHLVAELGIQKYFQGDCVVRKGDQLNRVIIIAQGEFDIVEEIQLQRETRNYYLENKLRPLVHRKIIDRNTKPMIPRDFADQSFDLSLNNNSKQQVIRNSKCYQYCNKQIRGKNEIAYTHLHVLKTLKKCDVICGRSLLILYDNEYDQEESSNAKLTVVVKSVQGQVFFLDEKRYQNLPESLQNQILAGLRSMKEFDDYEIDHIRKQIRTWEKYKQNLYKQFIMEKRQNTFKTY
ncbi:unnamed protein product (macronuclear) [Paramecium tetraurelia]|uniref:Cyclic nucleotide-binding domain-containing protein n=1 Tax=Paramecium tetraurelia TaxID=5888 RepID=A0E4J7_PARTE|nr:uncharacterized protein GSPATT00023389001 [Paramecium tetraurelia]CAK90214.1 unnamed protein product [Paramecium tetraurelia]|eukprot:XP_001457611.1 hypothetical protein (macronuclear) [Paramecium tetraurelia strain d4-2]